MKGLLQRFALLVLLLVSPSFAQDDPPGLQPDPPEFRTYGEATSPEVGQALSAASRGFGDAWGRGDAAAVASYYASDVEWTNAFGDVVRGAADLEAFLNWMFARRDEAVSAGEKTNFQLISLRYLGDDVAITHGQTTSTRGENRSGEGPRRVHTTSVWARVDGKWKIVHHMVMDARS